MRYNRRIVPVSQDDWLTERKKYLNASDAAAYVGDSAYKSVYDAWEEKTGRKEAPDLSNNPHVVRGKTREQFIRDRFIKDNQSWAKPAYEETTLYVVETESYKMSATLDLRVEVVNEDNPYNFPIGSNIVVEFKAPSSNLKTVENWRYAPPIHYMEQMAAQLICTGFYAAILMAEFEAEDGEYVYKVYDPLFADNFDTGAFEKRLADFYSCWKNDIAPDKNIVGQEIVISASISTGVVIDNFQMVKSKLASYLMQYKDVSFTESQAKEAASLSASLNKVIKAIDAKRLEVKREYCKPLEIFESKIKELKELVYVVQEPIKKQIDEFENNRINEKRNAILELVNKVILSLEDVKIKAFVEKVGVDIDERWLNKTVSMKAINQEILKILDEYEADFRSIEVFKEDKLIYTSMLEAYVRTRSLNQAIEAKERIEKIRAMTEAPKQEKGPVKASGQEDVQNDNPISERYFELTFKAIGTIEQFKALNEFLKKNNFKFEKVSQKEILK